MAGSVAASVTNLGADFVLAQLAVCLAVHMATKLHSYWPG